mmetsp:Transcript_7345/g.18224  ORF Transcript_7345/g.18224 Transcript_7345/m.18224 type:complete len:271 (-) Transcript_7345:449-1261(-)
MHYARASTAVQNHWPDTRACHPRSPPTQARDRRTTRPHSTCQTTQVSSGSDAISQPPAHLAITSSSRGGPQMAFCSDSTTYSFSSVCVAARLSWSAYVEIWLVMRYVSSRLGSGMGLNSVGSSSGSSSSPAARRAWFSCRRLASHAACCCACRATFLWYMVTFCCSLIMSSTQSMSDWMFFSRKGCTLRFRRSTSPAVDTLSGSSSAMSACVRLELATLMGMSTNTSFQEMAASLSSLAVILSCLYSSMKLSFKRMARSASAPRCERCGS